MKELITFVLKPLSFLPALAIMYMIYSFSGQTGVESGNLSYDVSVKIVEIGNEVLDKGLQDWEIPEVAARIEYPVRKLAHMSEYFILAVAVSFPFYVYGLRGFALMLVAGFICVGFAAGDEYHQSFVEGRGPSVVDVGIDSVGVFFGILAVRIVCFIFLTPARILERRRRRLERKAARRGYTSRRSYSSYECRSAPANNYRSAPRSRGYASGEYDEDDYEWDDSDYDYDEDAFDDIDHERTYYSNRKSSYSSSHSIRKSSHPTSHRNRRNIPYSEEDYEEEDYLKAVRASKRQKANTSSFQTIALRNELFEEHFEEQLGNEVKKFTENH